MPGKEFLAGAYAIDITPRKFPVIVNGSFQERTATRAHDSLHARCLVLDDGTTRVAIVVVDSCLMPRELLDEAKQQAQKATGIPTDRMLISATHTHSAPSVMGALGSDADHEYSRFLPAQIAKGIELAVRNLAPAVVGWAVARDSEDTHCRRWILRPDRVRVDPFGQRTVRAMMHPGYQNPDFVGPAGPIDPDVSMLSVQSRVSRDGTPVALLANYSMHYFGSPALSADYYGRFAEKFKRLIGADDADPPFVGIMSQGTSGDLHWMDYSRPRDAQNIDSFAEAVARVAFEAYKKIQHRDWAPLVMREEKLTLGVRLPDASRLAWAKQVMAGMKGPKPTALPEIYAREQLLLMEQPRRELKLQALRIGDLGIAAIPCEVFGITGLKIKKQSPLVPTFTIELANGAEGYIPPPEQHKLGGYTTWEARTAGLEVEAEPKIVDAMLELLEDVSGRSRHPVVETESAYSRAVLASKPVAYWRLSELNGPHAADAAGRINTGEYENGVAFYLEGPALMNIAGDRQINRAPHFAGGRMRATIKGLGDSYSVEMWFYNALPVDVRAVTGYLFSRGIDGAKDAPGDHLGIGGKHIATGRLLFFNGNALNQVLSGKTEISPRTWNHVVLVRDAKKVRVYLNGETTPEISGEAATGFPSNVRQLFIGGRNDNFANFEGKIDEAAVYDHALSADEVAEHYHAGASIETSHPELRRGRNKRVSAVGPFDQNQITGTFSIVAVDPETGECGAAVASKYPAVGKVVPYVRSGVGAFCTQHWHNPAWGEEALDLLQASKAPEEILAQLLRDDPQREQRQLAIIDMSGRVANHNPSQAEKGSLYWAAMSGRYYSCQGNTLTGREVIVAMSKAYEETSGSLTDRLMATLIAGDCAGGDHRGRLAAGIRVAKCGIEGHWFELYVDNSSNAVIDLARKYAELKHEAKGEWPGGKLPFKDPCLKVRVSEEKQ
ncbi:DUF1028 domain-containing protein, partial [bacterium]|nr:DUF1028 domain-containing protein [bacterium]